MPEQEKELRSEIINIGKRLYRAGLAVAKSGNRIGNISEVIQHEIEGAGYSVIKDLTGHGVGRKLHEEPMIPEYVRGDIARTPLLVAGMTLAIEVIYAEGKGTIEYVGDDGWALASRDRSMTATFEHTIVIGEAESTVLTKPEI